MHSARLTRLATARHPIHAGVEKEKFMDFPLKTKFGEDGRAKQRRVRRMDDVLLQILNWKQFNFNVRNPISFSFKR
jgi:hypothetical protein